MPNLKNQFGFTDFIEVIVLMVCVFTFVIPLAGAVSDSGWHGTAAIPWWSWVSVGVIVGYIVHGVAGGFRERLVE
jgi:hypothetical protein